MKRKKDHPSDNQTTWEDVEKNIMQQGAAGETAAPVGVSEKDGKKAKAPGSLLLKGLLGFAGLLVVVLSVMLGVRFYEGKQAKDAASAVLEVYLHKDDEKTAGQAEAQAPAATPAITAIPQATPAPQEIADLQAESQYMFEDDSANVDVTGDYIQPDAPELAEMTEATAEAIKKVGQEGVIGVIDIPEIKIELPIIGQWSYGLLKISVCRFMGPDVNKPGNLVLIGHNYKNGAHFGKLSSLKVGSEVYLTDGNGEKDRYVVYEIVSVGPDELSALETYEGDCGLTLVTCNNHGTERRVLRCRQEG